MLDKKSAQKRFGTQLRGFLKRLGLSQEELARRVHVSPSLVSHWLAGNRAPAPKMILQIAEALVAKGGRRLHPIALTGWGAWVGYEFPLDWFQQRYPRLSDDLWVGVATSGYSWQAERLPAHYVERQAELERLLDWLLTPPAGPEHMAGRRVAATGMPGVGKTTLAQAIAWHPRIWSCFLDGVLWASLGRSGKAVAWLGRWGRALGLPLLLDGDPLWLRDAVAARLSQRRCLLVVDGADRWEALEPLMFDAPGCATLLTTRDRGLAEAAGVGPAMVEIGVMSEEESLALLERSSQQELAEETKGVAAEVGYHPLALRVAGGLAREWRDWGAVLERLKAARLTVLGYEGSLPAVLETAYVSLSQADQPVFRVLGALAAGAGFAVDAVVALLGGEPSPIETELALTRLAQQGLVERLPGSDVRYRQHVLCADYAAERLAEAGELEQARARQADYYLGWLDEAGVIAADDAFLKRLDLAWENILVAHMWRQGREYASQGSDALRRQLVAGRYAALRDQFDQLGGWDTSPGRTEAEKGNGKGAVSAAYQTLVHAHAGRAEDAAEWLDRLEGLAGRAPQPEWPFLVRAVQLYLHLVRRDWRRVAIALEAVCAASHDSDSALLRETTVSAAQAVGRRCRRFAEEVEQTGQLDRLLALVEMVLGDEGDSATRLPLSPTDRKN